MSKRKRRHLVEHDVMVYAVHEAGHAVRWSCDWAIDR